ncbi:MAG: LysR family transcriptional regulator [Proteobacteria bacterium]|nr:LysR family transcriptional regulator [Pseudomonadota bacterium]
MSRKLPPLNALKAFEASARLGSFVLAAAELNVSPSAISQHIKKLEDFYGRQLFIRHNNQLLLTDIARQVYAASSQMMNGLAEMTEQLLGGPVRSNLIVSVLPSFGVRWLNRRLAEFLEAHPDVRVDLRLEEDPVDFFRSRIDVRICYGEHLYPEFVTVPFRRDRVTAMCQPKLVARERLDPASPQSLADDVLIHVAWRAGFSSYPEWSAWFASQGITAHPRIELGHTTDTSSVAIDLACSGHGVVLGQEMLAETELEAGKLVAPFSHWMPLQYDYCVVHGESNKRNKTVGAFVEWLTSH